MFMTSRDEDKKFEVFPEVRMILLLYGYVQCLSPLLFKFFANLIIFTIFSWFAKQKTAQIHF